MNKNHIIVEELRSIILDKNVTQLFVKNEEFSSLVAKYAKRVWVSKDEKRQYDQSNDRPSNIIYKYVDIDSRVDSVNSDVFLIFNKSSFVKKNYHKVFSFLERNLTNRNCVVIASNSFFDKRKLNAIIELTKNNLPLDIIINITKFKCHYIVIKRKERRDMYGFY